MVYTVRGVTVDGSQQTIINMADGDKTPISSADKLRKVFNEKYNAIDFVEKGLYDDRDVERVKTNDLYVRQFIRQYETLEEAANRLHEAMKWRKEVKINDITESTFETWVWKVGAIFYHNCDKDGRKLLFIRVKEHKKDPEKLPAVKAFFAYHLELSYNEDPEKEIVILFDMAETGLSNLDMDLIKFVITSFKIYYPSLLGYMLIYEMPWLFNAAWKIIKSWLSPQAVKKIKFVHKSDIQEYIDKDQLLEHMGGTDKFKYQYIPPKDRTDDGKSAAAKKRVTFSDQDQSIYRSFSGDNLKEEANSPQSKSNQSVKRTSVRSTKKMESDADNSFIGRLLTITPAEELEFTVGENGKEIFDTISLKNTLPYPIAYKVKTTSPEKYKVRPSFGIVKPGTVTEVYIYLQQAYQTSLVKDKFLIMAMEITSESSENISELWKTVSKENIMEHKLRCIQTCKSNISTDANLPADSVQDQLKSLTVKVDNLIERNRRLERTVKFLVVLQFVMMLFMVLALLSGYISSDSYRSQSNASSYCSGSFF